LGGGSADGSSRRLSDAYFERMGQNSVRKGKPARALATR
jgi:hypothetical protein